MPTSQLTLLALSSGQELAESGPRRVDALAVQKLRLDLENVLGALPLSEPITVRLG